MEGKIEFFNAAGHGAPQPGSWRGKSEQISFHQVGCESRKISAAGDVFFLTSTCCSENNFFYAAFC